MSRHAANYTVVLLGLVLASNTAVLAQAQRQTGPGDFQIIGIERRLMEAPNFGTTTSDIGGRGPTLARRWLRIETQFQSEPDWADDVMLKYYVLIGKGRDAKLFVGDVTLINIARGTHYSAVFIHPNIVKRFGAGQVEAVAVQLFHQNRLLGQESDPATRERWWERYTPVSGYILKPEESPWAPIAHERYDATKPAR